MVVRIAVNVMMSVQSFYLINVLKIPQGEEDPTPVPIALTPLISYTASLIFQLFGYQPLVRRLQNRFLPMLFAIVLIIVGSIPLFFIQPNFYWAIYICSPVTQIGLAIMMNTSTSLISDVIGKDAESSAFVYGFYSFMDKIANGVAIERAIKLYEKDEWGLRIILGAMPVTCAVLAFGLTYLGKVLYSERLAKLSIYASKINKRPMGGH
jgi:Na+/melibiose symporter-like transporter